MSGFLILFPLRGYATPRFARIATTPASTRWAAIASAIGATVLAEESETSLLAMAEIDAATATVTSQYTRLEPTADIAVVAGEVLVLNPIVWA